MSAGADVLVPGSRLGTRVALRVFRRDPAAWALACTWWTLFHALPVATGVALGWVLDEISGGGRVTVPTAALAVLAGVEATRWVLFLVAVVQFHGAWVGWQARIRMALLDSLVSDPGPVDERLPGSPGEAVSRFRDDAQDIALVLDVWLDIVGTTVGFVIAVGILFTIDPQLAVTIAAPALAMVVLARALGPLLRRWRLAARTATGQVTGFVGDTFGAIASIKAAGAEAAITRRFASLGHDRARHSVRDEVGTQMLYTVSGATADLALAISLVAAAPAAARGDLTVGDLGVVASFATVVAGLPRYVGRLGAFQRQADVSAIRLGRLLPTGRRTPTAVAGHQDLHLRAPRHLPADAAVGPVPGHHDPDLPVRTAADGRSRHPSRGDGPATGLEVRHLTVRRHGVVAVDDVDLTVRPGELVAVTGPVGAGKTSLLRAVLGLVPAEGTVRWDGEEVTDRSRVLVPPRVAYVPQVPRLFGEPLADAVLLGLPPERLDHALRLSRLERDVASMPDGLATVVGSRGVRLSGGQVQRVATARALTRRPALLVVDDLSSALDAATEAELWEGLLTAAVEDGTSVLVVTHRPAVLARADDVIRLRAGRRV